MSTYLVTGAAGFVASKVCELLLAEGHTVVGIDNLNDYYDVRLKDYRLSRLLGAGSKELGADPKRSVFGKGLSDVGCSLSGSNPNNQQPLSNNSGTFTFHPLDIENLPGLDALFAEHKFTAVFNLAGRAGVRYSIENPHVYLSTNTLGTLNLLECMRKHGVKKHVLASSSSLYAGCPMPFTEDQPVNTPLSPYAATKKAAEMLAWTWHKLHGIDTTVLRYFTVYGPAGRPDMAPFRFVHWVATGQPIKLFGDGTATRDFTFVDDIARGTILAGRLGVNLKPEDVKPEHSELHSGTSPSENSGLRSQVSGSSAPSQDSGLKSQVSGFEIINLGGGNRPITINAMIALIERELYEQTKAKPDSGNLKPEDAKPEDSKPHSGFRSQASGLSSAPFTARIDYLPPNAADMADTSADISKAGRLLGWKPQVTFEQGVRSTVAWYLENQAWLKGMRL